MPSLPVTQPGSPPGLFAFVVAAIFVILLVSTDQYTSTALPTSFWARFSLDDFPYRMTLLVLVLALPATFVYCLARRAPGSHALLLAVTLIGMQTNGIKFGGFDLITMMPLVVILFLLAESLRQPDYQIVLPGVIFFGVLLMILNVPYFAAPHIYGPGRYIINFISMAKGILVAFIFVNLIRSERLLEFAIRTFLVIAFISGLIGVSQIALQYVAGITINFAPEAAEWKPNFLGMTLRATGLTTWPSWLADFLVLALPFMLFRLCNATTLRWRGIYLTGIIVMLAGIFFTLTYAAWFATGLIFLVFPFLYWPRKAIHLGLGLLLTVALLQIAGGIEWVQEHFLVKVNQSTGMVERSIYLHSTLNEIIRDPWIGSGMYAEENFSENAYRKRVHNTGLQAWAALGLPGLLVFVAMMLVMLSQLALMAMALRGTDRQLFQALWLGVLAMILEMFAEPNLTAPVLWFCLGLSQAALLVYCTWRYPRPPSLAMLHAASWQRRELTT